MKFAACAKTASTCGHQEPAATQGADGWHPCSHQKPAATKGALECIYDFDSASTGASGQTSGPIVNRWWRGSWKDYTPVAFRDREQPRTIRPVAMHKDRRVSVHDGLGVTRDGAVAVGPIHNQIRGPTWKPYGKHLDQTRPSHTTTLITLSTARSCPTCFMVTVRCPLGMYEMCCGVMR